MTLHHPRHRAAMHWLRSGEIACGRAFDRQRNRLSASTDAMHATCADCWRVMAAIAAADQPSKVNDELVELVKAHAANLPRSGWRATKLRNVGRPGWKGPSADEARMLELLSRIERMGPVEQREALEEVARLRVALRLGGADG